MASKKPKFKTTKVMKPTSFPPKQVPMSGAPSGKKSKSKKPPAVPY